MLFPLSKVLVVLGSFVFASACASKPPVAAKSEPSRLTDAQIAAIVVAANQIDVENGELAMSRSEDPEVKKFAEQTLPKLREHLQHAREAERQVVTTGKPADGGDRTTRPAPAR